MFIQPKHASNHLLFSWPVRYLDPYLGHLLTVINTCKISRGIDALSFLRIEIILDFPVVLTFTVSIPVDYMVVCT